MINKTYNEWKKLGYYIKKGSKSCSRNNKGEALFSKDTTAEMHDYSPRRIARLRTY